MLSRLLRNATLYIRPGQQHDRLLARLFETDSPNQLKFPLLESMRGLFSSETEAKAVMLKAWNLCLARRHFRGGAGSITSKPLCLTVDPSNACHLACPGCVHSPTASKYFDWKPGLLSQDRLAALLALYGVHATRLTLYNYGEPLFNPQTPALVRQGKRYLLTTTISTNFSLEKFEPEAYVESGLDTLIVSADGATQGVYEKFRRRGNLALVIENIRRITEAKRRLKCKTPLVFWRFLMFQHNRHEVPLAATLAEEAGADEFRAETPFSVSWDDPEIQVSDATPVRRIFHDVFPALMKNWNAFPEDLAREAIDRAFAAEWSVIHEDVPQPGSTNCESLYKNLTMDAGGRVMPCCASPRKDGDLLFDNFSSEGLTDPFNSPKHNAARDGFAGRETPLGKSLYCSTCEFDKRSEPTPSQLRAYFALASRGQFSGGTLRLLSRRW